MSALSEQIKCIFNYSKDFLSTMKRHFILLLVVSGISTFRVLYFLPGRTFITSNQSKVTPVASAYSLFGCWFCWVLVFKSVVLLPRI